MALGKPRIVSISDAATSAEEKAQVESSWAAKAVEVAEEENGEKENSAPQTPPWVARSEGKETEKEAEEENGEEETAGPAKPETPEEISKRKEKEAEISRLLGEVKASAEQQREIQKQEDENKAGLPAGPQEQERETPEKKVESEQPVQPLPEETRLPKEVEEKKPKIIETRDYSLIVGTEKQQGQTGQAKPGVSPEIPASEGALEKFRRTQEEKAAAPLTLENIGYRINGLLAEIGKKFRPKSEQ